MLRFHRQKQRERRRKRKLKQLKPKPKIVKEETSCSHFSNTFGRNYNPTKSDLDLPRFFDKKEHVTDEDSEISSNEDRNLLSSVRFSRLVDSRRISKDYYALLQQSQSQDHSSTTRYTFFIIYQTVKNWHLILILLKMFEFQFEWTSFFWCQKTKRALR